MSKKVSLYLIFLLGLSLSASFAMAASCFDLVGDWEVRCHGSYYEPSSNSYGYEDSVAISHITSQNDCAFYGTSQRIDEPAPVMPITGVVSGNDVQITNPSGIARGRMIGPKQIEMTSSNLEIPALRAVTADICRARKL